MNRTTPTLFALVIGMLAAANAHAQQIAVQQPVVERFSVGTTVSMPDRGSMLLGSVGSAASGRNVAGPFRSGYGIGREARHSSMTAHVYIHDFAAMDEALLNEPTGVTTSSIEPRLRERLSRSSAVRNVQLQSQSGVDAARESERLAEEAEARGKPGVAKLHWQRAAQHGSKVAAQKLAENYAAAQRR